MSILDNNLKYGRVSITFHWLRVACLITIYAIVYLEDFHFVDEKLHRSLGILLFFILLANIIWRTFNKYPKSHAVNKSEKKIQYLVYFCIYVVLVMGIIFGYLGLRDPLYFLNTSYKIPVIYDNSSVMSFVDGLGMTKRSFAKVMREVHEIFMQLFLFILIAVHVGAVLYNKFIRKNDELKSML